jgi:hypothetical protein
MTYYQEIAQSAFEAARQYIKHGVKATNKRHDPRFNFNEAKAQRDIQRKEGFHMQDRLREIHTTQMENLSYVDLGWIMRATGNTTGNCGEATGLAASFIADACMRNPNLQVPTSVARCAGADHVFLIVGPTPAPINFDALSTLIQNERQPKSYVVDVWAGICCPIEEFPRKMAGKMRKWQNEKKYLLRPRYDGHGNFVQNDSLPPLAWLQDVRAAIINTKSAAHHQNSKRPDELVGDCVLQLEACHTEDEQRCVQALGSVRQDLRQLDHVMASAAGREQYLGRHRGLLNEQITALVSQSRAPGFTAQQQEHLNTLQARTDQINNRPREYLQGQQLGQHRARLALESRLEFFQLRHARRDAAVYERLTGQHLIRGPGVHADHSQQGAYQHMSGPQQRADMFHPGGPSVQYPVAPFQHPGPSLPPTAAHFQPTGQPLQQPGPAFQQPRQHFQPRTPWVHPDAGHADGRPGNSRRSR